MKFLTTIIVLSSLFLGCYNPKRDTSNLNLVGTWIIDSTDINPSKERHRIIRFMKFNANNDGANIYYHSQRKRTYKYQFKNYIVEDSILKIDFKVTDGLSVPENYGMYTIKAANENKIKLTALFNASKIGNPDEDSIIILLRTNKLDSIQNDLRRFQKSIVKTPKIDIKKLDGYWKHDSTVHTLFTSPEKHKFIEFNSDTANLNFIWAGQKPRKKQFDFKVLDEYFIVKDDTLPILKLTDSLFVIGIDNDRQFEAMYYSKIEPMHYIPQELIE